MSMSCSVYQVQEFKGICSLSRTTPTPEGGGEQEHNHHVDVARKRRSSGQPDASRNWSRKPSKAHAQASNGSPPTQADDTTLRQTAQHAYTSHNRQPAYQGAAHASDQATITQTDHKPTCDSSPCLLSVNGGAPVADGWRSETLWGANSAVREDEYNLSGL